MNEQAKLSLRCRPGNENHHLWDNNGTWWCHLTVHLSDFTKQRLRLSLETDNVQNARSLRDSLLALFGWTGARDAGAVRGVSVIGAEVAQ